MFSSLFGKSKKSVPEEDGSPPIPGPRSSDEFVVVSPQPAPMYPSIGGYGAPAVYPPRPAPPVPPAAAGRSDADQSFHYLQGVPFIFSKELQLASNKDTFAIEIGDLLAYVMNKANLNQLSYDFSVEKSVLKEY